MVDSCRKYFVDLSADTKKFAMELFHVNASNSKEVNEDRIVSMDVAIHMGRTSVMDYTLKENRKEICLTKKAWEI